jgi:RimJ/RimL family protein N-acetyltransferase
MTVIAMSTATNNSCTAGAIADLPANPLDRYIGQQVRLWPYLRGSYPKDTLYRLWSVVQQANAFHHLFWGLHIDEAKHGDVEHFCRYFGEDSGRQLFIVQSMIKDEIAGFLWLDDLVPQVRAIGSIFMSPSYRGKPAIEAVRLFCDYSFTEIGMQAIWGVTPWPEAARLIMEVGFERIALLPAFASVQGIAHDVRIFRLVKERFYQMS